ncbi:MAG TPA: putative peptidoglycan glycosyltransferase FtsW [candidate division Zixibacteria bacterium]|nr:putative peptidoglycan glycosyltransferase FtsW [candidate division Zixibacteria bacterium]
MKQPQVKGRIDERLLIAYLATVLAGVIMIYSTSSIMAESRFGSHLLFFRNQFVWFMISLAAIWVINKIDLQRAALYSLPALGVSIVLLCLVFLMPARNDAHRWLFLGPFTLQPSEMFRFALIFFLAFSLASPKRDIAQLRQLLMPYAPIIGIGLALILIEPDLGSTVVITLTAIGMFYLAGARMKHLTTAFVPLAGMATLVVFVIGYKKQRILDYMASIADPLLGSYQAKQAALTLGAGGILGTGLGEGRQKLFFLPYPHTDFIFAAIGEEVGLFGLCILLGLMFYILRRGLKIAWGQPDKFGFLLASGMTLSLFINIAINIGVVTSLLPVTGLPLPFISYGGSSLLVSSAAIGVLLNLSRRVTP